jgi:hypothetical protein
MIKIIAFLFIGILSIPFFMVFGVIWFIMQTIMFLFGGVHV